MRSREQTTEPSWVLLKGLELVDKTSSFRALDLGCGSGRNSFHLAKLNASVDAVDLIDLDIAKKSLRQTRGEMHFYNISLLDFPVTKNSYRVIVATRLLQYLTKEELVKLFAKINDGLTPDGIAAISYTASGGVFDQPEPGIKRYKHPIKEVVRLLFDCELEIFFQRGGFGTSDSIPGSPNETYDLVVKKKVE